MQKNMIILAMACTLCACQNLPFAQKNTQLAPIEAKVLLNTRALMQSKEPMLVAPVGTKMAVSMGGGVGLYQNGAPLWQQQIGAISAIGADDAHIVVGTQKGDLILLDAHGKTLWQVNMGATSQSVPLIHQGQVVVLTNDGAVVAYEVQTGKRAWRYAWQKTPVSAYGAATPMAYGEMVLIGAPDGRIYVLDNQGNVRFSARVGKPMPLGDIDVAPLVVGNMLYATSNQHTTAIDMQTGQVVFNKDFGAKISPIAFADGVVIVAQDGTVHLLDKNGATIWQNDMLAKRHPNTAAVLNDVLYVGEGDMIHGFDRAGKAVARHKMAGMVANMYTQGNALYVQTYGTHGVYVLTQQ